MATDSKTETAELPQYSEEFLRLLPRVPEIRAKLEREHRWATSFPQCEHKRKSWKGSNKYVSNVTCRDCELVISRKSRRARPYDFAR